MFSISPKLFKKLYFRQLQSISVPGLEPKLPLLYKKLVEMLLRLVKFSKVRIVILLVYMLNLRDLGYLKFNICTT